MIFIHESSGELVILLEYNEDMIRFVYGEKHIMPEVYTVDELAFVGWL